MLTNLRVEEDVDAAGMQIGELGDVVDLGW
jgi:hypothetical protein